VIELFGDEKHARQVLDKYDRQAEEEQFAEIETAVETQGMTLMSAPH
jgi:hypothetical protein